MNKKTILSIILILTVITAFCQTHTGSISLGSSSPKQVAKQQPKVEPIPKEVLRFTPKNGMLPYFEEPIYKSHEEANKILRLVGAEPMPDFYPGHNYDLPPLNTDLQKNLQKRVDYSLELTSIRYDFQRQIEGKSPREIVNFKPSPQNLQRSREINQKLKEIDTQIFKDIKNNTQDATRDILDFVIKRGNRGNISTLSNVMINLKETINRSDKENVDYDPSSGRFSPGGSSSFLSNEGLQQITSFIDNVINIVGQVSSILGIDEEVSGNIQQTLGMGKELIINFHQLFCIINTMFSDGAQTSISAAINGTPQTGANNFTPSSNTTPDTTTTPDSSPSPTTTTPNTTTTGDAFTGNLSRDIRYERLMENGEFTDTTTMTAQAIQQFLESRNSRLKDSYRGQMPSQIIHDVCAQYGINPKVIISTAQKEQSLITRQNVTENTLDWAMGVGCPDNGYHNPAYRGLGKQLESAIRIFKRWYDDGLSKNISTNGFTKRVNYGTTNQRIENEATYSLYMYTPHTYDIHLSQRSGGNYLFCQVYIGFFGGFIR